MSAFSPLLIVEDIPEVAEWVYSASRQCFPEAQVHQATNVTEARLLIQKHCFSLALLDIGLPDGSGVDLIPELLARNRECCCVMTTIFDDSEHLFAALKAGARGYLLKDESTEIFNSHLHGILTGQPPLSARIARRVLASFIDKPEPVETKLTARETDVLTLIAHGYSVRSAAESLKLSHHTVAGYLKEVYRKLQVNSRAEATIQAHKMGLLGRTLPS